MNGSKIIDLYQYRLERVGECPDFIYRKCWQDVFFSLAKHVVEGKPVQAFEYRPDGRCYAYQLEGSTENIACYILSNNFAKLFLNDESQPIFCARGTYLDLCVDQDYFYDLSEKIYSMEGEEHGFLFV